MKKKGYSAEQIIGRLEEAEVLLGQGGTVAEVSRKLGATEQTYYRMGSSLRGHERRRRGRFVSLNQRKNIIARPGKN